MKHFLDHGNRSVNAAREIILYSAVRAAHPNSLRMQNVELLNVDLVLHVVTTRLEGVHLE